MNDAESPQSEEEVRERLAAVVRAAEANGVEVRGAYQFPAENDQYGWEVQLFPFQRTEE